ncbi:MAG: DEAD/DEAH box helicase [Planctomycetes bacterium]|nr:DEAD/DEAH box helicase [Planctomycetota bacterium]
MSFSSLGLRKPILDGVRKAGYERPSEIQTTSIPIVLEGRDIVSCGETGSGKTAAFGLPILDRMLDDEPGKLHALVLVPTRELCVQVAENLRIYASRTDITVCTAFGGIDMAIQEAAIRRGCDVVVACPGRLIDHLERGNLSLEHMRYLVLDEADRMLDMGFMPQIRKILMRCPAERQTLLFSATMPPDVAKLVAEFIPGAAKVQVGRRSQAAATIDHEFEEVTARDKTDALIRVLRRSDGKALIFCKTKLGAQRLGRELHRAGLPADSIHGDKSAEARYTILQAFTRGRIRFLVATDVAARGIDVDDVAVVVNYDMPRSVEDYVHRVGRTGRAGRSGRAVSLWTSADRGVYQAVRKNLSAKTDEDAAEASRDADAATAARTGRRGGRPGGGGGGAPRGRGGRSGGRRTERRQVSRSA